MTPCPSPPPPSPLSTILEKDSSADAVHQTLAPRGYLKGTLANWLPAGRIGGWRCRGHCAPARKSTYWSFRFQKKHLEWEITNTGQRAGELKRRSQMSWLKEIFRGCCAMTTHHGPKASKTKYMFCMPLTSKNTFYAGCIDILTKY